MIRRMQRYRSDIEKDSNDISIAPSGIAKIFPMLRNAWNSPVFQRYIQKNKKRHLVEPLIALYIGAGLAHCSIVIFANIAAGGTELVKIDSDLNILAGPVALPTNHYYSIEINPDTGDLALWPNIGYQPGEYALVEKPVGW